MKSPQQPNELPPLPDDPALKLDEEIAAEEEEDELAPLDNERLNANRDPELTDPALENLTTWDEKPGIAGRRIDPVGSEDENDFPRQLAETGVDVADSEQREVRERDERVEEALEEEAMETGKTR